MRAVAYRRPGGADVFEDVEVPVPAPGPRDLVVAVRAVSVNPVDIELRAGKDPGGEPHILGYDAAGVVRGVGAEVEMFSPGDEVYYSGSTARAGTDAQVHVVDERIVGPKPRTLSFAEAAALPLTTIVAWETLFDRFGVDADSTGTLVVIGAAGGAGSMVIQLARALTGLTVIGTASRPESQQWARDLGAHHVVDHSGDLGEAVAAVAPDGVDLVFSSRTGGMIETYERMLRPGGAICAIDGPEGLELLPLKNKSITFHWELMFTRPLYAPDDMVVQHNLLETVAGLVDAGTLRTTLTCEVGPLDATTLRQAHELVEAGHMVGKVVLTVDS
ncbi:zinc-binding alcohol dehydrogenase family protein [Actinomycetospora corticicola]|nr:zinc-binding alcohol dehydrogenase family protein [Actinomycetospora corticicola]